MYGPEASNGDVFERSVAPLLRKLVEGYNVTVVLFGATGVVPGGLGGDESLPWGLSS